MSAEGKRSGGKEPALTMLGSTKVSGKLRITVPKDAAASLDVKDGDHIIFYVDENGRHIVKKG